ncbi:hypothetical protein JS82_05930 [Methanomassiliicoccaceae archaeon DOK]|nr:hypothetical protein JS82_05930 [Methanomassiliicoccaceae archaeon DOK]
MTGLTFLNVNPDDAYNDYGMDATEESLQNMFDSYREFYVQSGTRVDIEQFFIYYNDSNPYYLEVDFTSVTSGFGLIVRNDGITGTLNTGGDITVGVEITSYWGADFNATVSDSFVIHSIAQEVESVTISGATSGEVGDYIDLTATVDPSDADNPDVTWSITSGSNRATISSQDGDSCRINLTGEGSVTVRATADDGGGAYDTHTITVTQPQPVTNISITGPTEVNIGSSITLTATTTPSSADNRYVNWTVTSGSSRVTYDTDDTSTGGTITLIGQSAGSVTVRATADDGSGVSATYSITVNDPDVTYRINYNLQGGSWSQSDQSYTTEASSYRFTIHSAEPTRDGYEFMGWATNSSTSNISYSPSSGVTLYSSDPVLDLWAVWEALDEYTLILNANGGTLSSNVITEYESGSAHTFNLSGYVPTWGDRVFVGWAESANATSATVISGGSYSTSTLSSTLYAVWNTTYTVTYDTNGGTNTPSPQTYATTQSSHSFTVQSSSMVRDGYEFVGWGLTANDTAVTYQTGNTVNLTRAEPTITLYAVWAKVFTLQFDAGDGTGAPDTMTSTSTIDESHAFIIPDDVPTLSGHEFAGWKVSGDSTSYQPGEPITVTGTTVLEAVWNEVNTITLHYEAGEGATNVPEDQIATEVNTDTHEFTVTSTVPVREGYHFDGWSTTSGGAVEYTAGEFITVTGSDTLYAVWTAYTYITLQYNGLGGTNVPSTQTHETLDESSHTFTISSAVPVLDGYEFGGWALTEGGEAEKQPGETIEVTGSQTLYAVWLKINSFVLQYDVGEGSGTFEQQTHQSTEAAHTFTISETKPTAPEGMYFEGWDTDGDGQADKQPGETMDVTGTLTITAVYQQITYDHTVVFDANGGQGGPDSVTETTTEQTHLIEVPDTVPTMEGMAFLGWADSDDAESPDYVVGDHIEVGETKTVYAVWREAVVHITSTQEDVTVYIGTPFSYLVTTDVEGATVQFESEPPASGWLSVDSSGRIYGTPVRTDQGSYEVTVSASYPGYETATQTFTITVEPIDHQVAPTAGVDIFIAGSSATNEPVQLDGYLDYGTFYAYTLDIQFSGSSANEIVWTLNGEMISSLWNVNYTFRDIGEYEIVQTVKNSYNGGSEDSVTVRFTISGYPTVTFVSNGGSEAPVATASGYGGTIEMPADPTRDGYVFAGWFLDEDLTEPFNRYSKLTENITLYAAWTESAEPAPGGDDDDGGDGSETKWGLYAGIVLIIVGALIAAYAVFERSYYFLIPAAVLAIVGAVVIVFYGGI